MPPCGKGRRTFGHCCDGGANDIFEVRQDVRFYLQISRIQNLVADIAEKTIISAMVEQYEEDKNQTWN